MLRGRFAVGYLRVIVDFSQPMGGLVTAMYVPRPKKGEVQLWLPVS